MVAVSVAVTRTRPAADLQDSAVLTVMAKYIGCVRVLRKGFATARFQDAMQYRRLPHKDNG